MTAAVQHSVSSEGNKKGTLKSADRDRRKFARVPIKLGGRFLLKGEDYPLVSINVSCGGGLFRSKTLPDVGNQVICYLDNLGRLSGYVVRSTEGNFAVSFEASDRKRDKLADQLMWLSNKDQYGLEEARATQRYAGGKKAKVVRTSGQVLDCRVLDLSLTGVAFEVTGVMPYIGERVQAGRLHGIVVRAQPGEFAIRLVKPDEELTNIAVT